MLTTLFSNEIRLCLRKPSELLQPIIFGLITITLFVLAIGVEIQTLSIIATAVIWVIVLLAILLSSERLFFSDHEDGTLEQIQLAQSPFVIVISIKLIVHWALVVLPLIVISPLYAKLLFLDNKIIAPMLTTLLLGTPTIVLFSALGNALTLSLKRGSLLLGLIIAPLYIPVLIISISALNSAQAGVNYSGQLALLTAMALISGLVCLPAICGALKLNA